MTVEGSYAPGSWVGVATENGWLLADLAASDPRVGEIWSTLREGRGADAVLDLLLSSGLRGLGGFALLTVEDEVARIVARRPASVELTDAGGTRQIDTSAQTWADVTTRLPVTAVILSCGEESGTVRLPVGLGVTQSSQIALRWGGDAGAGPARSQPPTPSVSQHEPASHLEPTPEPGVSNALPETAEEVAAHSTPDYGDLFAGTATRAAFLERLATEANADPETAAASEPEAVPQSAPGPALEPSPNATAVWHGEVALPSQPPASGPHPPETAATTPTPSGVIDGVPWAAGAAGSATTSPPPAAFAASAAPPPPSRPSAAATEPDQVDVRTMGRAELAALQADPPVVGPSVLAVRCPSGHLTPPFAPGCRVCGARVDASNPARIARPTLGVLRRDGGDPVLLDRDVVLGRAPQATSGTAAGHPNLVKISDPGVSRSHVQITLDGWQVFVRDLDSSNGTELQLPGQEPEALRAHQDYLAEPGSRIIVAGDFVFIYEVGT